MYCSACGCAVPPGLAFCNRCGAKLTSGKTDVPIKASDLIPDFLVFGIVGLFVFGLGVTIGLVAVLRQVAGFDTSLILAITMICFTMIIALESVLVWLLFKSMRIAKESRLAISDQFKEQKTSELGEGQPRALPEHLTSVTEHTTRAF